MRLPRETHIAVIHGALKSFDMPIFADTFERYHQGRVARAVQSFFNHIYGHTHTLPTDQELDYNTLKASVSTLRAQHRVLSGTKGRLATMLGEMVAKREALSNDTSRLAAYLAIASAQLLPVLRRMRDHWPTLVGGQADVGGQSRVPLRLDGPTDVHDALLAIMSVMNPPVSDMV